MLCVRAYVFNNVGHCEPGGEARMGKQCPFFFPQQEEAEGKGERRGISKAERGRRTCYLQAWTWNLYIFK